MPPTAGRGTMTPLTMLTRTAAFLITVMATMAVPASVVAHGDQVSQPQLPGVLLRWSLSPLVVIGLVALAGAWVWMTRRVNAEHPRAPVPRRRSWFFLGGVGALALALLSPIEHYEGALFSVHMVQHMLLELLAVPLLLLAAPVTLVLRVSRGRLRAALLRILRSRIAHAISFPLVGWVVFAAVNWYWHLSPLYDQALESEPLHYLQHATFIGASALFWWPVIGLDPSRWRLPHPARLLYLFLAMPQNSFLGLAIYGAGSVLYPHYATNRQAWGPSPMEDQRLGGVLMWVGGDLVFLLAMILVVVAWMRHEERRTLRMDARLDAAARQ